MRPQPLTVCLRLTPFCLVWASLPLESPADHRVSNNTSKMGSFAAMGPFANILAFATSLVMSVPQALVRAGIALSVIAIIGGFAFAFDYFGWDWSVYGGIVGVTLGTLIGIVVLVRFSHTVQAAIVGAAGGMFVDLITTAAISKPATALNTLARSVADTVQAVRGAAETTGLPNPVQLPISIGIWCFVGTVALVFICGLISSGNGSSGKRPLVINIREEKE